MSVDDNIGAAIVLHEVVRAPEKCISRLLLQIEYDRIQTTMDTKRVRAAKIHLESAKEVKVVLGHSAEEQVVRQCHSLIEQARSDVFQGRPQLGGSLL